LDSVRSPARSCSLSLGSCEKVEHKERIRRPPTALAAAKYPLHADAARVSPLRHFCGTKFLDANGDETDVEPTFSDEHGKLGIWWTDANGNRTFHTDYW